MLAFALKTVRKLCFFPTLHYSCFTLVCAKDIIKQIRYLLLFTIYPFLETRKVLFPHNFTYEHYKLSLIFKSFSFYSSRSLVSYICKFFFFSSITLTFSLLFPRHWFCPEDQFCGSASPSVVGLKFPTCLVSHLNIHSIPIFERYRSILNLKCFQINLYIQISHVNFSHSILSFLFCLQFSELGKSFNLWFVIYYYSFPRKSFT